jgi:hypothetical protein
METRDAQRRCSPASKWGEAPLATVRCNNWLGSGLFAPTKLFAFERTLRIAIRDAGNLKTRLITATEGMGTKWMSVDIRNSTERP